MNSIRFVETNCPILFKLRNIPRNYPCTASDGINWFFKQVMRSGDRARRRFSWLIMTKCNPRATVSVRSDSGWWLASQVEYWRTCNRDSKKLIKMRGNIIED